MSKSKKRKKNNKKVEIIQDKQSKNKFMATKDTIIKEEVGVKKTKIMATKDIIEKAKKELADLTGFLSPSAIGFKQEGDGLLVTIEVIEKESIPDGMDVLGTYEVRVGSSGSILSYERTDLRKRVDTALDKEV